MADEPTLWNKLGRLLENYPSTADEVEATIRQMREDFPMVPTPKILYPGGPWDVQKPVYVHKTHLTHEPENFTLALENIAKTGRALDPSGYVFLRHLLDHSFGWSATTPSHHEDSWVHYLRHQYMIPDLVPILDDMTWAEDIQLLPPGYGAGRPWFELLADSKTFYVFDIESNALHRAGTTVEEVYWGMKKGGWLPSNNPENYWVEMADTGEEYDFWDYFPLWDEDVKEDGTSTFRLVFPLRPFVPHS